MLTYLLTYSLAYLGALQRGGHQRGWRHLQAGARVGIQEHRGLQGHRGVHVHPQESALPMAARGVMLRHAAHPEALTLRHAAHPVRHAK